MTSRTTCAFSLLAFALAIVPAVAQPCPNTGDTFWQNDNLPPNPPQIPTAVSVIPGLCEGEAAASVFAIPPGTPPQQLTQVVAPWGAAGGVNGQAATLNVEIYDGIQWSGGIPTLGPQVFDLNGAGSSMQVMSHGLNTLDVSSFNIVVGNNNATHFVVAFRVNFNPSGACATGYNANLFTDNMQLNLFCNPNITPTQTNLIDITGQGWRDAATATVTGIPLCPIFYSGNWVIRACSTNAAPPNPFNITVVGSPASPGGFINLTLNAPGMDGLPYILAASASTSPGIPTAFGTIPLTLDPFMLFSLDPVASAGVFINFQGTVGIGTAPAVIIVPNVPALSGLSFFLGFVVPFPGGLAISDAVSVGVL